MTPRERAKKCKSECLHLDKGACGECIEGAITAAVAEEREAVAEYVRTHTGASSSVAPHIIIVEHTDAMTEAMARAIRARGKT